MEENMKEQLEKSFSLLKTSSEKENEHARNLKRKISFLFDMTSLLFKYDLLEWEGTEKLTAGMSKTIDVCDKVIAASEKVKTLETPLQPWGELIPERMEALLRVSQEMGIAVASFQAYLENPENIAYLNSYNDMLLKKIMEM